MSAPWHYLPGRLPKLNVPVLVVKGNGRKSFVREAVYTGGGYWQGFGDAPVRAWQALPHTPISLALKAVLDERDSILDTFERKRTPEQQERLLQIERQIELAQQARDTEHERFMREACVVLGEALPTKMMRDLLALLTPNAGRWCFNSLSHDGSKFDDVVQRMANYVEGSKDAE